MADPILLDTGILISVIDTARADHSICRELVERHPSLAVCAQTCREFLAVSTRPTTANGLGMTSADACRNLEQLRCRISTLAEEKPLLPELLNLVKTYNLIGRGIHDAGIVAAAQAHRIKLLVTSDAQIFTRYAPEISVISPAEVMASVK